LPRCSTRRTASGAILRKLGVDPAAVRQDRRSGARRSAAGARLRRRHLLGRRLKDLLEEAGRQSKEFKDEYVSSEHLLLALAAKDFGAASRALKDAGVAQDTLLKALAEVRGNQRVTDPEAEGKYQALSKYTRDLTELARNGKLDPVIGRDEEIRRAMQVLSRRTKNNPVLIGDPASARPRSSRASPSASQRRRARVAAATRRSLRSTGRADRRQQVPR
jgi:ATP-dependent Clp protease ATP-binding subunit ClpB